MNCSQASNGIAHRLDHESFHQSNIERVLHLDPEYYKNELERFKIITIKDENCNLVNFQLFSDSSHRAQLEQHQVRIQLDKNFLHHGTHRKITFDS